MRLLPSLSEFARRDDGALTINVLVLAMGLVGLGVASSSVVDTGPDHSVAAYDQPQLNDSVPERFVAQADVDPDSPNDVRESVCTPDGRYCAYDHNGDGLVDELRNKSRGQSVNVEGNGLTIQGYRDSGWS